MSLSDVFNRKVSNVTGIDITVPCHQEVEGPLGGTSVEYIINTILRMKIINENCNEDEVSEYKTSKSFRECEDFYTKLRRQYPSVEFPELPSSSRKPSASLDERRKVLDEFLQYVASTGSICTCQLLLKFLGIDPSEKPKAPVPVPNNAIDQELSSAVFEKVKLKQDTTDATPNKHTEPKSLFADAEPETPATEDDDDNDIFRDSRKRNATGSKPLFDQLSLNTRNEKLVNREPLLFDPQDYGGPLSPDDEHLFLVPGAKRDIPSDISVSSLEETEDLLSLDDNIDDFLQQINQKKKKRPSSIGVSTSPPPTVVSLQAKPDTVVKKPETPVKPEAPLKPEATIKPEAAIKSEAPAKPETPVKPVIPVKPATPVKPALPSRPASLVKPVLSAKPSPAPKPTPAARGASSSSSNPLPAERPVPKPRKKTVPARSDASASHQESSQPTKSKDYNDDDGDIDILKYIEQEEKAGQTDINLFS